MRPALFGPSTLLASICATLVCAAPARAQDNDPWILGGKKSAECAWPTVMMAGTHYPEKPKGQDYGLCTGTLVHPRVLVYAAHCGDANKIVLGNDRHQPIQITEFEKFGRHPDWKNSPDLAVDWGYAVLKKPIPNAVITPIAYGCELEMLQKTGADVRLVGYSDNGKSIPPDPNNFIQQWASTKILSIGGGGLKVGGDGVGVRSGDSGGPVMVRTKDGSWRTVGIVSLADGSCAAVRKEMIDWLTKETGIDILPCFDADGKPTPGKACDEFYAFAGDPDSPVGNAKDACKGAPVKWAGLACGLEKSDGSDPNEGPKGESTGTEGDASTGSEGDASTGTDGGEGTGSESDTGDDSSKTNTEDETTEDSTNTKEDTNEKKPDDTDSSEKPKKSKEEESGKKKGKESGKQKKEDPEPPAKGGCSLDAQPTSPAWTGLLLVPILLVRRLRSKRD